MDSLWIPDEMWYMIMSHCDVLSLQNLMMASKQHLRTAKEYLHIIDKTIGNLNVFQIEILRICSSIKPGDLTLFKYASGVGKSITVALLAKKWKSCLIVTDSNQLLAMKILLDKYTDLKTLVLRTDVKVPNADRNLTRSTNLSNVNAKEYDVILGSYRTIRYALNWKENFKAVIFDDMERMVNAKLLKEFLLLNCYQVSFMSHAKPNNSLADIRRNLSPFTLYESDTKVKVDIKLKVRHIIHTGRITEELLPEFLRKGNITALDKRVVVAGFLDRIVLLHIGKLINDNRCYRHILVADYRELLMMHPNFKIENLKRSDSIYPLAISENIFSTFYMSKSTSLKKRSKVTKKLAEQEKSLLICSGIVAQSGLDISYIDCVIVIDVIPTIPVCLIQEGNLLSYFTNINEVSSVNFDHLLDKVISVHNSDKVVNLVILSRGSKVDMNLLTNNFSVESIEREVFA